MRIKIPSRDEAIAAGLSALALGLVMGLAIGPGIGGTGSLLPAFAGPLASVVPGVEDVAGGLDLPALEAPAGSSAPSQPVAAAPSAVPTAAAAPTIVYVDTPAPADPPVVPAGNDPGPSTGTGGGSGDGQEEGLPLEATVVGVSVTGRSYAVADESGNLFTVYSNGVPAVGDLVATEIAPLSNGTFGQLGERVSKGRQAGATMRGVVSYVDEEVGILVLSSRGTSIPVLDAIPKGGDVEPPEVGTSLTAQVEVIQSSNRLVAADEEAQSEPGPLLRMVSAEASFYEDTAIEFSGIVRDFDPDTKTVVLSADGEGLLAATVTLGLPGGLKSGAIVEGRTYSVTARRTPAGALKVTGLSPGFSRKAADDRKAAFGEHA